MKRKLFLTVVMSALFASSQLVFLAPVSAHPAAHIRLSVASSSATVHNGKVVSIVSRKKVVNLGNSEGQTDIRELQAFVNASVKSFESFNAFENASMKSIESFAPFAQ